MTHTETCISIIWYDMVCERFSCNHIRYTMEWCKKNRFSFSIIIVEFLQPVQTPFSAPLTTPDLAITNSTLGIALLNTLHHQEYDGWDVKFKTPWRRKPFSQWHANFQLKPTLSLAPTPFVSYMYSCNQSFKYKPSNTKCYTWRVKMFGLSDHREYQRMKIGLVKNTQTSSNTNTHRLQITSISPRNTMPVFTAE